MLTQALDDALKEFEIGVPTPPRAILLVDDEVENLESLCALLEGTYEVHTATRAATALQLLSAGVNVDLIVADQRMPDMTGVELLAKVAATWPDTIRIVLTAYDDVGPMMTALNRGSVFRFLLKPCAPEVIRSAIADGLSTKHGTHILRNFITASVERQDALDNTAWDLKRTRDYLLAAERLTTVGRAASGILHNIRNLGTIMSILVSEIQSSTSNSEAAAAGRAALQGFGALVKLLENVREFTRINDAALELSPTEMEAFLRQTVAIALLQEGGAKCPVAIEVDADCSRLVIDRTRVRHAVTAVLSNALKASTPGSPIAIQVRTCNGRQTNRDGTTPTWVTIAVRDRGCGMDTVILKRATEPLFSHFLPPGLGLGLSVASLAAEIHGGDLLLDSHPGQGTCVSLRLPTEPIVAGCQA